MYDIMGEKCVSYQSRCHGVDGDEVNILSNTHLFEVLRVIIRSTSVVDQDTNLQIVNGVANAVQGGLVDLAQISGDGFNLDLVAFLKLGSAVIQLGLGAGDEDQVQACRCSKTKEVAGWLILGGR